MRVSLRQERLTDSAILNVVKERPHVFSVFVLNEDGGFVCFCKEFETAGAAFEYASRVTCKLIGR